MVNSMWVLIFSIYFFISGALFGIILVDDKFKALNRDILSIVITASLVVFWPISLLLSFILLDEGN